MSRKRKKQQFAVTEKPVTVKTNVIASRKTAADAFDLGSVFNNPDRILEKLGLDQYEAYRDTLIDPHLAAVRESRRAAVLDMEWDVVGDNSSEEITDFIKENLENVNMSEFFSYVSLANDYGMSPIEVVYKVDGGKIMIKYMEDRPSRWFCYDDNNQLRFLSVSAPSEGKAIPPRKILCPRNNPTYENPYGDALLSRVYWPVYWKRNATKWWNVFIEKYGMPWPWVKYPPGTDSTKVDEIVDHLSNAVQDNILATPNDASLEFLEASGTRSSDIYRILEEFQNAEISKVYLGQTLTTEMGDVGSYAASETHKGIKDERRDADVLLITRTMNTLIGWLVEMNYGENAEAPRFVMFEPNVLTKERAEIDAILAEKLSVKFTEKYLEKTYNLEPDDYEIVEQQPEPEKPELSLFATKFKDQASMDAALKDISKSELQKQAEGLLKPVIDLINNSSDYSEALDSLLTVYPKMDTDSAEEMLTRAIFVSELLGRGTDG